MLRWSRTAFGPQLAKLDGPDRTERGETSAVEVAAKEARSQAAGGGLGSCGLADGEKIGDEQSISWYWDRHTSADEYVGRGGT